MYMISSDSLKIEYPRFCRRMDARWIAPQAAFCRRRPALSSGSATLAAAMLQNGGDRPGDRDMMNGKSSSLPPPESPFGGPTGPSSDDADRQL
jgi:hypothetical protein